AAAFFTDANVSFVTYNDDLLWRFRKLTPAIKEAIDIQVVSTVSVARKEAARSEEREVVERDDPVRREVKTSGRLKMIPRFYLHWTARTR
ncbi:hypothetical protein EJB05_02528, partial [Eragrostis curvula]